MPSRLFIFVQRLPTISFSSYSSLSSSYLHILSNSSTSIFSLPKPLPFLHFFISHNLKLSFSPKLSLFSNGTQDQNQENLLCDFQWSLRSHSLGWSHKVNRVSSTKFQAINPPFRGCMNQIGKFFNFSHFQVLLLIFCFNPFLDLWMLGFCCEMGLDEILMS